MSNFTSAYNTLYENMQRYTRFISPHDYQLINRLMSSIYIANHTIIDNGEQWLEFIRIIDNGLLILINFSYPTSDAFNYIINFYNTRVINPPSDIEEIINEMRNHIQRLNDLRISSMIRNGSLSFTRN